MLNAIYFSVEKSLEIEPVAEELTLLNAGVEWHWVILNYADGQARGHAGVTIELSISKLPVCLNAKGELVSK